MSHAFLTVVCPLALERMADAQAAIEALGNPAEPKIRAALDRLNANGLDGTHFASLHAFCSADGERGYVLFEISADGPEDAALARIVDAIGHRLRPVFILASDWRDGGDLAQYMRSHRVAVGSGWSDNPGVNFSGTPTMAVGRILAESKLASRIAELLAGQPSQMQALQRVEAVRADLKKDNAFAEFLEPATAQPPYEEPSPAAVAVALALSFVRTYLWPVVLLVLIWGILAGVWDAWGEHGFWPLLGAFVLGTITGIWAATWVALASVLVAGLAGFALLRKAEARDSLDERTPDRATNAAMFARENRQTQNHMISITQRKPGLLRAFTSRLVFWAIGALAARSFRPGFLGDIGTIHFARWVTPPGSPDLIFLSNYDSSWESYLEDFITRAHAGLTGVWSNAIGFPRTVGLIGKGATDGERFKRWARRSMVPTRFWYSAYPDITTALVRSNAEVRRGLSGAMTEDEAVRWLALFGSSQRPASKLVNSEIQSLILGGMGFLREGTCLVFELPDDVRSAKLWLGSIYEHIAFNDGRRLENDAVVTLALGASGLRKLGLPDEGMETFPFAFLEGMTTPARSRILGDTGEDEPAQWRWGKVQPDVVLLVYGDKPGALRKLVSELRKGAAAHSVNVLHTIPLAPVGKTEPFGFADGISQPVIRGTYKALRSGDPIQVVEAGEFILGYPDNRGNLPPSPSLPATADPTNELPLQTVAADFGRTVVETTRDVGFNGSFLVIRELEQDVESFAAYCRDEADALNGQKRFPFVVSDEFVAAKLIGRWKDGASLVRHPNLPPQVERQRYERHGAVPQKMSALQQGNSQTAPETARLRTKPGERAPVDRPLEGSTRADNDFLFGAEDPEALRCPFGAHIRRSNPRDSFDPGSADQIAISNRHRIIRVGRQYKSAPGQNPGILFMCWNGDIERQFEFLQQTWLKNKSFHGLACEKDPLLGDTEKGASSYTIPTRDGPVRLSPLPRFVTTRGGGYFFVPGKRLIKYLSASR